MMMVSRLLKSCAMPPVSWPTASIFCACRSASSTFSRSLMALATRASSSSLSSLSSSSIRRLMVDIDQHAGKPHRLAARVEIDAPARLDPAIAAIGLAHAIIAPIETAALQRLESRLTDQWTVFLVNGVHRRRRGDPCARLVRVEAEKPRESFVGDKTVVNLLGSFLHCFPRSTKRIRRPRNRGDRLDGHQPGTNSSIR